MSTIQTVPEVKQRCDMNEEQSYLTADTLQNAARHDAHHFYADLNGKVTEKQPPEQTRVGQQIHTPARFVQLVHTVLAPNDIYCRPRLNCK